MSQLFSMPQSAASEPVPTIAIIGGGFSGMMVATHLLRQATRPLQIKLIERRSALGGVAYGTALDCHLLNVPAGKISAFAELPDHFCQWLKAQSLQDASTRFVPRNQYKAYLHSVLAEAQQAASQAVELEQLQDEAAAVYPSAKGAVVQLKSGQSLLADQVVLALGNFPPADPAVADRSFYQSQRYISNPWSRQALNSIDLNQPLLLAGSGLTMLDWAVGLHQLGFRHTIYVVSRHGLLPQPHQSSLPYALAIPQETPRTVRAWLRWLRQEVELAQQQGRNWRAVIDGLRPHTQSIWQALPLAERRRFLRHVRPYWEVHRHRVAPQIAETVDQLLQNGQMQLQAGRIQSYFEYKQGVEVQLRLRHSSLQTIQVGTVINCTGSEANYRKLHSPLIRNLLQTGLIQPDSLGLGLEVATNGALMQANGQASDWLFTLGSAQKGNLWETTAVPELRQQAALLAQVLLQQSSYQLSVSDSYQISKSRSFKYSSAL